MQNAVSRHIPAAGRAAGMHDGRGVWVLPGGRDHPKEWSGRADSIGGVRAPRPATAIK
jgi:hypothetical protein